MHSVGFRILPILWQGATSGALFLENDLVGNRLIPVKIVPPGWATQEVRVGDPVRPADLQFRTEVRVCLYTFPRSRFRLVAAFTS